MEVVQDYGTLLRSYPSRTPVLCVDLCPHGRGFWREPKGKGVRVSTQVGRSPVATTPFVPVFPSYHSSPIGPQGTRGRCRSVPEFRSGSPTPSADSLVEFSSRPTQGRRGVRPPGDFLREWTSCVGSSSTPLVGSVTLDTPGSRPFPVLYRFDPHFYSPPDRVSPIATVHRPHPSLQSGPDPPGVFGPL